VPVTLSAVTQQEHLLEVGELLPGDLIDCQEFGIDMRRLERPGKRLVVARPPGGMVIVEGIEPDPSGGENFVRLTVSLNVLVERETSYPAWRPVPGEGEVRG
jgi:hypothetical protein